jgi:predicted HTH domain antitoxin
MIQLRDFYTRTDGDAKYEDGRLEISDDLESAIQQIKMTLFTNKGEVLGEPDFGLDIEKYLFEYSIDSDLIAKEATMQINRYSNELAKRSITVDSMMYPDEVSNRDIFVLLINLPEQKDPIAVFYD